MPESRAAKIFGETCLEEGDYTPIIESFGDVVVRVDDSGWTGDTYVLLRKNDKLGILVFGWGSCSGCDALQACRTLEDRDNLIDHLERNIKWFDTLADAQSYMGDNEAREREFYLYTDSWKHFQAKVLALPALSSGVA